MSSPFPTLFICLSYIYVVKVAGPKIMENRKPFQLKNILIVYNLFQVIFSAWLFYEVRLSREITEPKIIYFALNLSEDEICTGRSYRKMKSWTLSSPLSSLFFFLSFFFPHPPPTLPSSFPPRSPFFFLFFFGTCSTFRISCDQLRATDSGLLAFRL